MTGMEVDDQYGQRDDQITADRSYGEPDWNVKRDRNRGDREGYEGGGNEQFVRHRVQERPQCGLLLEPAGQQSVESIGDTGHDEYSRGALEVAIDQQQNETRNEDHSQDRQLIGVSEYHVM